ncbi:MAG: carbon-nitrogen hydrolase family protein [Ardenticatenia bacterium]|jgi:predicted amidohydrolase|nr:MAG: carbon-nitrogen hydrolase family protein [Ardenticatenia bacterium]
MRQITVAVVQMQSAPCQVSDNLKRMSEFIDTICRERPIDLIVFPELATTGFECGVRFTDLAEKIPGHTISLLAQQAAGYGTHIVFGLPIKEKVESILYNAAVMIGPNGEVIGDYRKVHLRGEEHMAFRPGFRYPVLEAAFGMVGIMLGWDLAFPEVARSLALDGAEIICLCACWERPFGPEWRAMVPTRAFENSIFIAAANRIGQEPSYIFAGQSMIVGARAETLTAMDDTAEGYAIATLDLDEVRRVREEYQLFQLRQPTTYRALVRRY